MRYDNTCVRKQTNTCTGKTADILTCSSSDGQERYRDLLVASSHHGTAGLGQLLAHPMRGSSGTDASIDGGRGGVGRHTLPGARGRLIVAKPSCTVLHGIAPFCTGSHQFTFLLFASIFLHWVALVHIFVTWVSLSSQIIGVIIFEFLLNCLKQF